MTLRRTVLVTGANRGVGRAIAEALAAREGYQVLAAARDPQAAQETAQALGGDSIGIVLDLSRPERLAASVSEIEAAHGPIDILINNAGVLVDDDADWASPETLEYSLTVNARAPHALIAALGPGMKARGWGRIVNVSSEWGSFEQGLGGPAAYAVSKATLNAITVRAARALAPEVKVNSACPGWVRTRMGGGEATSTPAQGADTPVWLATLPDDGPTGGFFQNRSPLGW